MGSDLDPDNEDTAINVRESTDALEVRDLEVYRGRARILHNVSITVERGSIYALLGPSGCGKTTLLLTVLGQIHKDSGAIHLFGFKAGDARIGIPGSEVGYMPQEIALFDDLSFNENAFFFGRINQMCKKDIQERISWLQNFLELPMGGRPIAEWSSGQQRRASIAMALLHQPRFLVLDEPTVGLDPILRAKMWTHFRELSDQGVTLVITTHFMDEAKHADRIGIMRSGCILDEDRPDMLMQRYERTNMDDVFLVLCGRHQSSTKLNEDDTPPLRTHRPQPAYREDDDPKKRLYDPSRGQALAPARGCWARIKRALWNINAYALLVMTQLYRAPFYTMAYMFVYPALLMTLICLITGSDPYNLKFVIVDADQGCYASNTTTSMFLNFCVNASQGHTIGWVMNQELSQGNTLTVTYLPNATLEDGLGYVQRGDAWGLLYIPPYFSVDTFDVRRKVGCMQSNESDTYCQDIFSNSTSYLYMDSTSYPVLISVAKTLRETISNLTSSILGHDVNPVRVEPPVFGMANPHFMDFVAPGIFIYAAFISAVASTALVFVRHRSDGTLQRMFVGGMRAYMCILGRQLREMLFLLTNNGTVMIVGILVFNVPCFGNGFLLFVLLFMLGLVGFGWGLVIAAFCRSEMVCAQVALTSVLPVLLLSGIIWPVEAMPEWIAICARFFPTTWACEAARSIMLRGWGFEHTTVWLAFLIVAVWAAVLDIAASILLSYSLNPPRWCSRRAGVKPA